MNPPHIQRLIDAKVDSFFIIKFDEPIIDKYTVTCESSLSYLHDEIKDVVLHFKDITAVGTYGLLSNKKTFVAQVFRKNINTYTLSFRTMHINRNFRKDLIEYCKNDIDLMKVDIAELLSHSTKTDRGIPKPTK